MGTLTSLTWLPLTCVFYRPSNPFTGGFRIFHYITFPQAKFFIEFCFQYFVLLGWRHRCLVLFLFLLLILLSVHVLSHLEESIVFCFIVASIGIPTFMGGFIWKESYNTSIGISSLFWTVSMYRGLNWLICLLQTNFDPWIMWITLPILLVTIPSSQNIFQPESS